MEPFSLEWAAHCMGGRIHGSTTGTVTSVCVDSRQVKPGALFFALQGENVDGHRYVAQALQAGAVGCVVERVISEGTEDLKGGEGAQIVVPAALRALGELARHYRRQFAIPIVGITGSVGKTSTKEMIAAILRATYKTLASEKNYNTETGVPLTLFNLDKTHEIAVIEMGMRGLGQIDYLAEIAEPTIGVITNIGHAHIELLGSQENIARAKAELFARLPANGVAIFNTHTSPVIERSVPAGCRKITFTTGSAQTNADVCVLPDTLQVAEDGTPSFQVRVGTTILERPVKLQAVGAHHVSNALAALAVAYALALTLEPAVEALEAWQGADGRMTVRRLPDNITVLDDCYNASPESMLVALNTLYKMTSSPVAVLGDMRELGEFAERAHEDIGKRVHLSNTRLLITVGSLAASIADVVETNKRQLNKNLPVIVRYDDAPTASAHIRELVRPGDTVLVKGSRAMGMEVIVDALMRETQKSKLNAESELNATGEKSKDAHD